MLEIFEKSYYVEYIEKEKHTKVDDILDSQKKH